MKSTVSKKRPTVNRNSDLDKLKAELVTESIALIVQVVLWMYQMACQQNVRHRVAYGASAMPQYEYSRKISQKSHQPSGRPAIDSKAAGSQTISGSFLGSFAGASLTCLLFLITALVVALLLLRCKRTAYNKNGKKDARYVRVHGPEQPESSDEETSDDGSNEDFLITTNTSDPLATANLKNTTLSELPPDLEDLLVKKLDVRRKGERLYGWQKVGKAFKIPSDVLKYLNIEYKRDNGSPTSKLLLRLGKTVSDLVNVLKSPKVNLSDVASLMFRSRGLGE